MYKLGLLFFHRITTLSEAVHVDEGKVAIFNCTVDANPNDDKIVSWDFPDKNFEMYEFGSFAGDVARRNQEMRLQHEKQKWKKRRRSEKIDKTTTMLTISKVKRDDAGRVVCRASNGVGGETTRSVATTYLVVNRK